MSWRRGELWLDTDLLWFREAAAVSAVPTFTPAPIPPMGPPPGLDASLRKREAWKQRRRVRRARAQAIALSPAVMFLIAGLRSASDDKVKLAEDPPSSTFRLDQRIGRRGVVLPRSSLPAPERPTEQRHTPKIHWRHAVSLGLPYSGSLVRGTQLPVEGPDWVTWNPAADQIPNAPHRLYGNQHTISMIVRVTRAYREANPKASRVVIGDISWEGGGVMDEHVSHQNGLDVDVYYPRRDRKLRAPLEPGEIDHRLAQDLLRRFVAAGAQMVFVGYSTGLRGPSGVVMPWPNHENHMHVRFPPPS